MEEFVTENLWLHNVHGRACEAHGRAQHKKRDFWISWRVHDRASYVHGRAWFLCHFGRLFLFSGTCTAVHVMCTAVQDVAA